MAEEAPEKGPVSTLDPLPAGDCIIRIGNYTISGDNIRKSIGHGWLSKVYKARHTSGNIYAAKHLDCRTLDEERKNDLKVFLQMEWIQHQNIMKIHERIEDEFKDTWLIMDYCDLGNLNQFFKGHPDEFKNFDTKLDFMCQIADGLEHLHSNGIVHRNLKPGNILVTEHPNQPDSYLIKLADFTLSKFLDPCAQSTMSTDVCSDVMYTAPEFYFPRGPDGKPKYKKSIDVYAAGLLFLAMLQEMLHNCLVPQIEGEERKASEVRMPIGQIMFIRESVGEPYLKLVDEKPENGNAANMVRRVIEWATDAEKSARISATEMHGYLEKIKAHPDDNLERGGSLQATS